MRVMIVVTHLLGTGHLSRAMTLAKAFGDAGHEAHVVSGGMPAPHLSDAAVTIHQLPPVGSDGVDFSRLLDENGGQATEERLADRRDILLSLLDNLTPHVVITELFPFGRRILRGEFEALLHVASGQCAKPLILSSIRDILAPPSKPKKRQYAEDLLSRFYDGVLVHGDPEITPLDLSWPVSKAISPMLRYTGFVAPKPIERVVKHGSVLVSTGGGSVGDRVFRNAMGAARLMPDQAFEMLVGGSEERRCRLAINTPPNVTVQGLRPDFRNLLAGAAASVSFAGYNTCLDVLQSGVPAVLVPFDEGNEVEQGIRAKALASWPGVTVCDARALTPEALARAVRDLLGSPRRAPRLTGMDGAARSVEIVAEMLGGMSG